MELAGQLSLQQIRAAWQKPGKLTLSPIAKERVNHAHSVLDELIASGETYYGVNTGFGALAGERIQPEELQELQHRLLISHATGVGRPLEDSIVSLALLLKVNSLIQGYSGIRLDVVHRLLTMFNQQMLPVIPEKGSVGASGDLAPLAHMSLPLIGHGKLNHQGQEMDVQAFCEQSGNAPLSLMPKEGLSLINGTQITNAMLLNELFRAEVLLRGAIVIGALTVEATGSSHESFHGHIHLVRQHQGQMCVAKQYRALLRDSPIREERGGKLRVQDPYSIRCQAQVLGACFEQIQHALAISLKEANAVSDNPILELESKRLLSGGNFHAQNLGFAADGAALAICEVGALSERRMALMMDSHFSHQPAFLAKNPGLGTGFMLSHVTATSLAGENKMFATPASIESLPTSANQEDHVSQATNAARKLRSLNENLSYMLAIELMMAAAGIENRRPLQTTPALESVLIQLYSVVPAYDGAREMSDDIMSLASLLQTDPFQEQLSVEDLALVC